MAAPNIVGINTMIGVTTSVLLSTTNATTIVNNAVDSQKVFKINTIMIANVDGSSAADITVALHPLDDGGGTGVKIANTISVAADSTLVLTDRASAFYINQLLPLQVQQMILLLQFHLTKSRIN